MIKKVLSLFGYVKLKEVEDEISKVNSEAYKLDCDNTSLKVELLTQPPLRPPTRNVKSSFIKAKKAGDEISKANCEAYKLNCDKISLKADLLSLEKEIENLRKDLDSVNKGKSFALSWEEYNLFQRELEGFISGIAVVHPDSAELPYLLESYRRLTDNI